MRNPFLHSWPASLWASTLALLALVHAAEDVAEGCIFGCNEQYVDEVYYSSSADAPQGLVVADMNKDGVKDIVFATGRGVHVMARTDLHSPWQTVFTTPVGVVYTGSGFDDVTVADFDGDGWLDIAAAVTDTLVILFSKNNGTTYESHDVVNCLASAAGVTSFDIDGDGDQDFAVSETSSMALKWSDNYDGIGEAWVARTAGSGFSYAIMPIAADANGDGFTDVFTIGMTDNKLRVHLNLEGDGNHWYTTSLFEATEWGHEATFDVGDLNGDGRVDILLSEQHLNTVRVFLNDDGDTWQPDMIVASDLPAHKVTIGDMDADGDLDLVVPLKGAVSDKVVWFENVNGLATQWEQHGIQVDATTDVTGAVVSDLDGDGDFDLIVMTKSRVQILESNLDVTVTVTADAPPGGCALNTTEPICGTVTAAVALAGRRPLTVQLADEAIEFDATIFYNDETKPLKFTMIGIHPTAQTKIMCRSMNCVELVGLPEAVFENLRFQDGGRRALVLARMPSVIIKRCMFVGMTGGAILASESSLVISQTTFQGNKVSQRGGALLLEDSHLQARDCAFIGNIARFGGAIFWDTFEPIFENVTMLGNDAYTYGDDLATPVKGMAFESPLAFGQESGKPVLAENGGTLVLRGVDFYGHVIGISELHAVSVRVSVTALNGTVASTLSNDMYTKTPGLNQVLFQEPDLAVFGVNSRNVLQFDLLMNVNGGLQIQQTIAVFIQLADCSPGTFRDYSNLYVCTDCVAGQYSSQFESPSCTPCDAGHYCDPRSMDPQQHPCPAGTFGATRGLGSSSCTAPCSAGFFCPPGSTTDEVEACGSGYYCKAGTSQREPVEPGYCWVGASEEHAVDQELCLFISHVSPLRGPTSGGTALTIQGGQFKNVSVSLGDPERFCAIDEAKSNLTQLVCTTPEGVGVNNDIRVTSFHEAATSSLQARYQYGYSYSAPVILSVVGCGSTTSTPTDCPTRGGSTLTIIGKNFGNDIHQISVVLRGSTPCSNLMLVVPHERITCTIPSGVGSKVSLSVAVEGQVGTAVGFSYAAPTVEAVSGCSDTSASGLVLKNGTLDCPRTQAAGAVTLTISGQNFGNEGITVLLGGKECTQVVLPGADNHTLAACTLLEGSGDAVTVSILQNNGQLSAALPFVAYEACPPGQFNAFDTSLGFFMCQPCLPHQYASEFQAYTCANCPAGYFSPDPTSCLACDGYLPGSTSSPNSTSASDCYCPAWATLTPEGSACTCTPGEYYDLTFRQCKPCDANTYSDTYNMNKACVPCPVGSTTNDKTGAYNASMCVCTASDGLVPTDFACTCQAGYYYKSSEDKCIGCSVGFYNPEQSMDPSCVSCDNVITGGITSQTASTSPDDCICPAGTYFQPEADSAGSLRGKCVDCPNGASCASGSDITTIAVQRGYWRTSTASSDVRSCENADACAGGDGTGSCAEGYTGTLCAVCDDGYSDGTHYRECTSCGALLVSRILMLLILVVLPVVWLLGYVYVNATHICEGANSTVQVTGNVVQRYLVVDRSDAARTSYGAAVGSRTRVLVIYYQILATFALFAGVSYPDSFDGLLTYLSVLNLDVISSLGLGCSLHVNYFDHVIFVTLAPLALLGVLGLIYVTKRFHIFFQNRRLSMVPRKLNRSLKHLRSLFATAVLLVLYFALPGVSSSLFAVFGCVKFDDGSLLLRADYSIDCKSSQYYGFIGYTVVMLIVYPLGVTAVTAWLLVSNRRAIHPPNTALSMAVQQRTDNERLRAFDFLFTDYKPQYWWFEIFECGRRVTLTGMPVLVLGSSTIQVVLVAVTCFATLVLLVATKPFMRPLDNLYACGAHLCLFLVAFIGLLLKYDEASDKSDDIAALLMLCGNALLVVVVGISIFHHVARAKRAVESEMVTDEQPKPSST